MFKEWCRDWQTKRDVVQKQLCALLVLLWSMAKYVLPSSTVYSQYCGTLCARMVHQLYNLLRSFLL